MWLVLSCGSAHYAVQRVLPWIKSWSVTFQMKATEQYFPVVLFILLHKVILAAIFGWNSSILHLFYIHTFYGAACFYTSEGVSTFIFCGWAFTRKQRSSAFLEYFFGALVINFGAMNLNLKRSWATQIKSLSRPFLWYCVCNLTVICFLSFWTWFRLWLSLLHLQRGAVTFTGAVVFGFRLVEPHRSYQHQGQA